MIRVILLVARLISSTDVRRIRVILLVARLIAIPQRTHITVSLSEVRCSRFSVPSACTLKREERTYLPFAACASFAVLRLISSTDVRRIRVILLVARLDAPPFEFPDTLFSGSRPNVIKLSRNLECVARLDRVLLAHYANHTLSRRASHSVYTLNGKTRTSLGASTPS